MIWVYVIMLSFLGFTHAEPYPSDEKIKGLSFVGTPNPYTTNPMTDVAVVNANYLSLMPFGYTLQGKNRLHFNNPRQWWGEKTEGIQQTIRQAHQAGFECMLKPHVYVPGSWIGQLEYEQEADWETWENDYRAYILHLAQLAETEQAKMLCIGTEIKTSVSKRPKFWEELIKDVRAIYTGQLTYSANWDHYQKIPFWDRLDYIGISAYFPLTDQATPEVKSLTEKWAPIKKELKAFSDLHDKPILFTEFGYLSVDSCASKTWELERNIHQRQVNQQAQANAINAIFTAFWNEPYWAGGFLWKWFPNGHGHEGYPDKDYTPQNKLAEEVITNWYCK